MAGIVLKEGGACPSTLTQNVVKVSTPTHKMAFASAALTIVVLLLPVPPALGSQATGWRKLHRARGISDIAVTFAIKQNNPTWLYDRLNDVSSPGSQHYGEHLNFDEISSHVYGNSDSVEAVLMALESVGVASEGIDLTLGNDFAVVRLKVSSAEVLFNAEFHYYASIQDKSWRIIRSQNASLGRKLSKHIDFVSGVSNFPSISRLVPFRSTHRETVVKVDPLLIDSMYNISGYTATNDKSSQGIASFLRQYYSSQDLAQFLNTYNISSSKTVRVMGKNNESDPRMEATLDIQYVLSTGRNVSTWFISVPEPRADGYEDFLTWIVSQVNNTNSPFVHSVSYSDIEATVAEEYRKRIDLEFMKFGVSGRTVLIASGDSGVFCNETTGKFVPSWPSSSPYITAVGGTEANVVKVWFGSGGGFSNVYPTPDYQKDVVAEYLRSDHVPPRKYYNASGRGYPDVSAFAVSCQIVYGGEVMPVDGTSCATPIWAGRCAWCMCMTVSLI